MWSVFVGSKPVVCGSNNPEVFVGSEISVRIVLQASGRCSELHKSAVGSSTVSGHRVVEDGQRDLSRDDACHPSHGMCCRCLKQWIERIELNIP